MLDVVHGLYDMVWSYPQEDPNFVKNYTAQYYPRTVWKSFFIAVGFEFVSTSYNMVPNAKNPYRYYYDVFQKPLSRNRANTTMRKEKESPKDEWNNKERRHRQYNSPQHIERDNRRIQSVSLTASNPSDDNQKKRKMEQIDADKRKKRYERFSSDTTTKKEEKKVEDNKKT